MGPQVRQSMYIDDRWTDGGQRIAVPGPVDFLNVQYGAHLINCGALVEGLQAWVKVQEWGEKEIGLIARAVDPIRLVNAVAEYRYGEFGQPADLGVAMMAIGAALGPWATMVPCFFEKSNVFITRVVGCRHHMNGPVRLDDLSPGDRVLFVPEPDNPYDVNAVQVLTVDGHPLGYIRRPIARKMALRIRAGERMDGRVALVMAEADGRQARVYVRVEALG